MSKKVDERIVSMQFDNSRFEKNVQTSMNTLDKLKAKLSSTNVAATAKSMENLANTAKKVDMKPLADSAEAVSVKFSALQVMGVTALTRITNAAITAGKRIATALTITPIKTGFQEYETQMNAVQTILANTKSKGSTLDDVNKALDQLNKYADQTIYNFTEMTRNIGTFTAAGVDLDKSVTSIKGIANLAAVSGSTSQQASTAMYQLSQALAAGKVQLMDWNSVVNAGMGGQLFQDALKRTAKQMGTNVDEMIKKYGSFRESLTKGEWLTAEVLTETLTQLSGAYTEADLIAQGYTEKQAKEITELANTAVGAATEVKTFTQLWDVLKEAAQSGWAQSWKIIVGDFEEAKALLTPLSKFLTKVIENISNARNKLLKGAMNNPLTDLVKKIDKSTESVSKAVDKVKDYNKVVNEIINGDWGNGQNRFDKLTKAGYDWAHAQNLVNEKLGDSTRHTTKYKEEQEKLQKTQQYSLDQLSEMNDAQLKQAGYSKDQIDAIRELGEAADKANMPLSKFVETIKDKKDGRTLLIESFKNAGQGLVAVITAIHNAWKEVFPPMTSLELYGLIVGLNKFSENLKVSDETADKLKRTLKGVFAILDIALTVIGGPINFLIKSLFKFIGMMDINILEVTASIGDSIVAFRDWIDNNNLVIKVLKKMAPLFEICKDAIKDWAEGFADAKDIGKHIIDGLVNGLKGGVGVVVDYIENIGHAMIEGICKVLGIHSPSVEFYKIGTHVIQGFINGFTSGTGKAIDIITNFGKAVIGAVKTVGGLVWDIITTVLTGLVDFIRNISIGDIIALSLSGGLIYGIKKTGDVLEKFAGPFEAVTKIAKGVQSVLDGLGSVLSGWGKKLAAEAWVTKSKAIINFAIAVAILTASLLALTAIKPEKLWSAVGVIAALAGVVLVLAFASNLASSIKSPAGGAGNILAVTASLYLLALAMKQLANIKVKNADSAIKLFESMIEGLLALVIVISIFGNTGGLDGAGLTLAKIAGALYLMVKVVKSASKLTKGQIKKGLTVVGTLQTFFMAFVAVLGKVGGLGQYAAKAGGMLVLLSIALYLMIGVVRLAAGIPQSEIGKGIAFITTVGLLFAGIIAVSKLAGQYALKAGAMLLGMSIALSIIVGVIDKVAKLDDKAVKRGLTVISVIELLFAAVIACSHLAGENALKAGGMLFLMSLALMVLVGVIAILGMMKPEKVAQGIVAISILEAMFVPLLKACQYAKGCAAELKALTIAIGVIAGAVLILSFLKPEKLAGATAAITLVTGAFAALVASTRYAKNTKATRQTLLTMLGIVLVLGGVVAALSLVDAKSVLPNATALSVLLLAFSSSIAVLSKADRISTTVDRVLPLLLKTVLGLAVILGVMAALKVEGSVKSAVSLGILLNAMASALVILGNVKGGKNLTTAVESMKALGIVVGELAIILGLMSALNVEASIGSAVALGLLLNAMAGAMVILDQVRFVSNQTVTAMMLMGVVVLELAVILGVMAALNVKASIPNALAIGTLLNLMATALLIASYAGPAAMAAMPAMMLMGIVVAELGIILGLMSKLGVEASIPNAIALGSLLILMSIALIPLSIVGGLATAAIVGVTALIAVIAEIGLFIGAIGALVTKFPQLEEFLNKGVPIIKKIGEAIGGFFGSVIKGFTENATSGLPKMAKDLSNFMVELQPFIEGTKKLNKSMVSTVSALAQAIIILTAADLIDGITKFFTGKSSLDKFGDQLAKFGPALKKFNDSLKDLKADDLEKVKIAAEAVKYLAKAAKDIPNEGGWLGKIFGENNIADFGESFSGVGKSLIKFVNGLGEDFGKKQLNTIKYGCQAIIELANAASEIPNEGGILGDIVGNNSIAMFAGMLPSVGKNLRNFLINLGGEFGSKDLETFKYGAKAIEEMAKIKIENSGGILEAIMGCNDLASFALSLTSVGQNLKNFLINIGTFSEAELTTFKNAAAAVQLMAGVAASIAGIKGGLFKPDLPEFAAQLPEIGKDIADFMKKAGKVDKEKVENSIGIVGKLASLTKTDFSVANEGIKNFASAIKTLANGIVSFGVTMNGIETEALDAAVTTLKDFVSSLSQIDTTCATHISNLGASLSAAGQLGVKKFVEAFTGKDGTKSVKDAAGTMMSNFATGLKDKNKLETIKTNAKSLASKAASAMKGEDVKLKFVSAGNYCVSGFTNAINSKDSKLKAYAAGKALGLRAVAGTKEGVDAHSPSREFYKIGDWSVQGLVNALYDLGSNAFNAGKDLGDQAKNGLSRAIAKVSDLIEGNVDAQPTIRPVLDLSNISSGAGLINDMLDVNPSVGVLSNIGAINSMMRTGQNGSTNDDIISAINKLGNTISGMSGNTYNVNGVTYDDGSNIANAVQTIARAAIRERRI